MALMNCPECGQQISDKAKKCIHCGKVFEEETADGVLKREAPRCRECGAVLAETDTSCPNCGCPVTQETAPCDEQSQSQPVQLTSVRVPNKTKRIIIGIVIALLVCAAGGIGFIVYSGITEKQKAADYIDNLEKVQELMLSGGGDAESLCNLTIKVWHNAIYKEIDSETDKYTRPGGYFVSDFNTALSNFYEASTTKSKVTALEENQAVVKNMMKKLQEPPKNLEKCYDTVCELYASYEKLTGMAQSPTGSYNSFSSSKNSTVTEFLSIYSKLDSQIPEKE